MLVGGGGSYVYWRWEHFVWWNRENGRQMKTQEMDNWGGASAYAKLDSDPYVFKHLQYEMPASFIAYHIRICRKNQFFSADAELM